MLIGQVYPFFIQDEVVRDLEGKWPESQDELGGIIFEIPPRDEVGLSI
jgi:hypothetical protein